MSRKITRGMGEGGRVGRGGNQITRGFGTVFGNVWREVLRACSRIAKTMNLESVIKWRRTS
jgi:hypothetical protein